ncbi:MAG TPA: DUF5681 domain-containing protein [Rickettsiales bacterium]|nr:DUF5681 domain-containing protein [Rickettsiales bacterium]
MSDEYEVGYKKPPAKNQFKPGQSGNPKGRRKGAKNFATAIHAELEIRIPITENGKRRTISKREAIAKQLVNKAVSGDPKTVPILLNETREHDNPQGTGHADINALLQEDRDILRYYNPFQKGD